MRTSKPDKRSMIKDAAVQANEVTITDGTKLVGCFLEIIRFASTVLTVAKQQ